MLTDTIAAISTGGNNTGINIIRISGENSKKIINEIFTSKDKLDHQKIIYGKIKDNEKIVDEVLVSCFKAPNSFTGEDVYEINCHGGRRITLDILEIVLKKGARIAEAGEFSKRAFLNGKMDLSKAESIIDIINATTKKQTNIAIEQLNGGVYDVIKEERDKLIEMLAHIEVGIDYPEYDYEELTIESMKEMLETIKNKLVKYIETYKEGKYIKSGINIAILGGTNAGKSSLLNLLAKEDKAIVTDIEGTTRDIVEETVIINDVLLNIFDTAGIRDTEDVVEKIGIQKSKDIIKKVDLIILVVDSLKGFTEKDEEILKLIKENNKEYIICLNKIDLSCENENKKETEALKRAIQTSFLLNQGTDTLKDKIVEIFNLGRIDENKDLIIVNERHYHLLQKAKKHIEKAINIS
ncbi:MAG: tRNA uridine-5-carboxymethylaminomethyl(34) synthesis GTPase MnmE, partial [Clostridia bacterium]|nr:tRNA uridine-5-carboxymethylaminomethyl(34) synthesis GTPase MnmE [Clostridia bacterium]